MSKAMAAMSAMAAMTAMTAAHNTPPPSPGPPVEVDCNGADGENLEEVLLALAAFEREMARARSPLDVAIPAQLEAYLKAVADDGTAQFPWCKIKSLFRVKLEQVIVEFNNSSPTSAIPPAPNVEPFDFDAVKVKVFDQLDAFVGIPFTVQRLAELITSPKKHYKRTDKFMRAFEKNMLVVTTVEARAPPPAPSGSAPSASGRSGIVNGNDHNVLPVSHLKRAPSPTSSGFVKSSRLSESPSKDSDMKTEVKDAEPSVSPKSNDEDKENIKDEGNIREAESKKPDSSESFLPNGNDETQVLKTSEADSKSAMDIDEEEVSKKDGPSTSEEDASKSRDGVSKEVSTEEDLASSSSDATKMADDDSIKMAGDKKDSEDSAATSSVAEDSEHQKPDGGEPNTDDGGPCDSAESNQDVSSALNSKTDESQIESEVGSSESESLSESASATETKNISSEESRNAQSSSEQLPTPAPSEKNVSDNNPEDENMEVDGECTCSDTPIHTSSEI